MSAETILTNVLLEVGLDIDNPQLSGTNYDVLQIRQFMNAAGKDVASRAEWSGLISEESIAGSVSEAALPSDFYELTETGAVRLNKADFAPVRNVIAPEMWALLTARPSSQAYFHLAEGKVLFSPALDSDGAVLRYLSNQWVVGKTQITQNSDTLVIPERLVEKGAVWRWKRQKGLPYEDWLNEYEADILAEIKASRGAA